MGIFTTARVGYYARLELPYLLYVGLVLPVVFSLMRGRYPHLGAPLVRTTLAFFGDHIEHYLETSRALPPKHWPYGAGIIAPLHLQWRRIPPAGMLDYLFWEAFGLPTAV